MDLFSDTTALDEAEDISPEDRDLRNVFKDGVRQVIQELAPLSINNYEKTLAWFDACKWFVTPQAVKLFRLFHASQKWEKFKPDPRDFVEWLREREETARAKPKRREIKTFGDHGRPPGALVMFYRTEFDVRIVRFGRLEVDERGNETARMWYPIATRHRAFLCGRIWQALSRLHETAQLDNWKISFLDAMAPGSWADRRHMAPGEWPEGLRDLYESNKADIPKEAG